MDTELIDAASLSKASLQNVPSLDAISSCDPYGLNILGLSGKGLDNHFTNIITVTSLEDEVLNNNGKTSLREAIDFANLHPDENLTILMRPDTYHLTRTGSGEDNNSTGDLDIADRTGKLTILSPPGQAVQNNPDKLTGQSPNEPLVGIDATGLGERVLDIFDGDVTLIGLKLTGGSNFFGSGAIANRGHLTLVDTNISGSSAALYAFGDSYSDNGASLSISTEAVDADVPNATILPPFLEVYDQDGRWTNGPGLTAVEVLAKQENLSLTDYAVGGAKSANGNLNSWLDAYQDTGLFGQIEQYKKEVNGTADSEALYFIFISTNDLLEKFFSNQPDSVKQLASQSVNNIVSGISELVALGAKNFFVVNSTDLSILPLFEKQSEEASAAKFTDTINDLLPRKLHEFSKQLDVEITLYDHVAISDKIRAHPAKYGLTNLNEASQPLYSPRGFQPGSPTPDKYYFYDEIHPTRRVHQIIGEDMANYLETQQDPQITNLQGGTTRMLSITEKIMAVREHG